MVGIMCANVSHGGDAAETKMELDNISKIGETILNKMGLYMKAKLVILYVIDNNK